MSLLALPALLVSAAWAQAHVTGPLPAESAWDRGLQVEMEQSAVLGGWAVANLAAGTAGALTADEPFARSAWGTSAAWNSVNLALAGGGLLGAQARRRQGLPHDEAVWRQHRGLRTVLGVNLALDGLYVGTGAAMFALGGEVRGVDVGGVGLALAVQGLWLAAFDAVYLLRHRRHAGPAPRLFTPQAAPPLRPGAAPVVGE